MAPNVRPLVAAAFLVHAADQLGQPDEVLTPLVAGCNLVVWPEPGMAGLAALAELIA